MLCSAKQGRECGHPPWEQMGSTGATGLGDSRTASPCTDARSTCWMSAVFGALGLPWMGKEGKVEMSSLVAQLGLRPSSGQPIITSRRLLSYVERGK